MDWNGDGKHDWKDDAFIHTVLHSDDDSPKIDPSAKWSPSGGTWAIIIIVLIIISFFF